MTEYLQTVIMDVIWPSIREVRMRYKLYSIENTPLTSNHRLAKRTCVALQNEIRRRIRTMDTYFPITYIMVADGSLGHNPHISSYWWKYRHSMLEVHFGHNVFFIEPFGDLIKRIDDDIKNTGVYEDKPPFYFYPDDANPAYWALNQWILEKTSMRINPMHFVQFKIWANISDWIRFHVLKKKPRRLKS